MDRESRTMDIHTKLAPSLQQLRDLFKELNMECGLILPWNFANHSDEDLDNLINENTREYLRWEDLTNTEN